MAVYRSSACCYASNPPQLYPSHELSTEEMQKSMEKALESGKESLRLFAQFPPLCSQALAPFNELWKTLQNIDEASADLERREQVLQEQKAVDEELYGRSSPKDSYRFAVSGELHPMPNVIEGIKAIGQLRRII